MDGRLTFLDSQDRLTNQRLTRAEVRSAFGPQLTNYVFQRARENTEERRKRAQ